MIAERGVGTYLIDLGNGKGQIANIKEGVLYPPRNIDAIIARGYWEVCDFVDAADMLAAITPGPSR